MRERINDCSAAGTPFIYGQRSDYYEKKGLSMSSFIKYNLINTHEDQICKDSIPKVSRQKASLQSEEQNGRPWTLRLDSVAKCLKYNLDRNYDVIKKSNKANTCTWFSENYVYKSYCSSNKASKQLGFFNGEINESRYFFNKNRYSPYYGIRDN